MSIHHIYVVPLEVKRVCWIPPGTVLTDGRELLCGHWESNMGPLGEQLVKTRVNMPLQ